MLTNTSDFPPRRGIMKDARGFAGGYFYSIALTLPRKLLASGTEMLLSWSFIVCPVRLVWMYGRGTPHPCPGPCAEVATKINQDPDPG